MREDQVSELESLAALGVEYMDADHKDWPRRFQDDLDVSKSRKCPAFFLTGMAYGEAIAYLKVDGTKLGFDIPPICCSTRDVALEAFAVLTRYFLRVWAERLQQMQEAEVRPKEVQEEELVLV